MSVDANATLIYGFVEDGKRPWTDMEDVEGDEHEKWEKLTEGLGITFGHMGDGPRYIAAQLFTTTHRYRETIKPKDMVAQSVWDENLKKYAKAVGIKLGKKKPQWTLLAYFD